MRPRVFVPEIVATSATVPVPADEARHLVRVLRASVGDEVAVFNGRGGEWLARIESAGRSGVVVRTLSTIASAPELATRLIVAQAVLKGDGMDDVVRDVVMLGAAAVQPVISARTALPRAALSRGGRIERWQRVALASAKQCGRAVVPSIEAARSLDQFAVADTSQTKLVFVEPSTIDALPIALVDWRRLPGPSGATVAIGPEGGWSPEEMDLLVAAGFQPCSLGRQTLRAERAAIVALAMLRCVWESD